MDESTPGATVIEISTATGPETYREFYLFNFTKSARKLPPLGVLCSAICTAATLIIMLALAVPPWAYIPPALLLTGIALRCLYRYLAAPSAEYKRLGPLATTAYQFLFYPDRMDVTMSGTAERGSGMVEYTAIKMIYETGTGFYIYLTDGRAYIISKKQITDDQIIRLRGFFAGHFIKRFKCLCSENRAK